MLNESIYDFIENLSSKNSMPGGGAVAALNAAEAASLTLMVCNLTIGKEKYSEYEELVSSVKKEMENYKNKFLSSIEEDVVNFDSMINVYRMPKSNEEEVEKRNKAMSNACKICLKVPFDILNNISKAIDLTLSIVNKSNKSAMSDLAISAINFSSAAESSFINILINIKYILDTEYVKNILTESEKLVEYIKNKSNTIVELVSDGIKKQ